MTDWQRCIRPRVNLEESHLMSTDNLDDTYKITRTEVGLKQYVCLTCSHASPSHSKFVAHFRTHTGEKPFACPFCTYRANQKSNLRVHIKCKHEIQNL